MPVTEIKKKQSLEDDVIEFRLRDIIKILKDSRKTVVYWSIAFFVIGALYAFTQKNEYTASVKVMPELKTSTGSGFGDLRSLASLAGVSLGGSMGASEAIRPDLYPDVIQSIPFSLYILNQLVIPNNSFKKQPLKSYLIEEANSGISNLFGQSDNKAKDIVSVKSPLQLTPQQEALCKSIHAQVSAEMDKKNGIITITSRMPDPAVAATVASQTLNYLTNYVTNYRTGKAQHQVKFLTQQVNTARQRYETTERILSNYRDQNRNLFLNTAKIEEQRLQADYLLAQSVYSDLSKQLEQARIKVQEEAPIFQVLEPPRVPTRKSGPKRTIIIIGFTIFGAFVGLVAFLIRYLPKYLINNK
ncbi:Wzz/FepE/Etk N-terminal domain-containing protein [Spirosoma gilvum]